MASDATPPSDWLRDALRASTRRDVLSALGPPRPPLNLQEIHRLTAHLASLSEEALPLRVAILRTYSTELLAPYWKLEAHLGARKLDVHEAPLGSLFQEGQPGSGTGTHEPRATFFFLQWQDLDPRFLGPLGSLSAAEREDLAQACERRLLDLLRPLRDALPGLFVVTLLPRPAGPELGLADAMASEPLAEFFARLKCRFAAAFRASLPGVVFFDLDETLAQVGRQSFFDMRLWHLARFPFSVAGAQAVARGLFNCAWLLDGPAVKCIVLDADNTLWGGIVGEDGPEGIALGPEAPGSCYVAFQRRLLELSQRGILLALCSRNNPEEVQDVLQSHPHQILRPDHFAAIRVDWKPKIENLRAIADELNLGLESFLFVDDSPQECMFVRERFPQMAVVRVPESAAEIASCLDGLSGLERLGLTAEDTERSGLYAQERQRRRLEVQSSTVEEYLASLRMVMTVALDDPGAAPRIAQLHQKTNQFNLTLRRHGEDEISRSMRDPNDLVAHFSLADVFGDAGIVGAAIVRGAGGPEPEIETFLLSCRVIGRGAETAFLRCLLDVLAERGASRVRASYIPTSRNALVRDFWTRHGFRETAPGKFEVEVAAAARPREGPGPISVVVESRVQPS